MFLTPLNLIVLVLIVGMRLSAAQKCYVRVIDSNGNHVKSSLFVLDSSGKAISVVETSERGDCHIEVNCPDGYILKIHPASNNYFPNKKTKCPLKSTNVIEVTSKYAWLNLQTNAILAERNGKYAKASMLWQEAAARAGEFDATNQQENFRVRAIDAFGVTLGVANSTSFDKAQKRVVMTPQMQNAVKDYQHSAGIKVTGSLDYNTVSKASKDDIGRYLCK